MTISGPLRRYLKLGATIGQVTFGRAEELLKDARKASTQRASEAKATADDAFERSAQAGEHLVEMVGAEVARQLAALGLHGPEDVARLAERLRDKGRSVVGDIWQSQDKGSSDTATDPGSADHPGAQSSASTVTGIDEARRRSTERGGSANSGGTKRAPRSRTKASASAQARSKATPGSKGTVSAAAADGAADGQAGGPGKSGATARSPRPAASTSRAKTPSTPPRRGASGASSRAKATTARASQSKPKTPPKGKDTSAEDAK